jgi:hypothetical protein
MAGGGTVVVCERRGGVHGRVDMRWWWAVYGDPEECWMANNRNGKIGYIVKIDNRHQWKIRIKR